jgi:hypothetical protein
MSAVLIVLIVFTFIFLVTKMKLEHSRERDRLPPSSYGDASLTTSELRAMIKEAVAEAQEPLEERFEELERRIEQIDRPRLGSGARIPAEEPSAHTGAESSSGKRRGTP